MQVRVRTDRDRVPCLRRVLDRCGIGPVEVVGRAVRWQGRAGGDNDHARGPIRRVFEVGDAVGVSGDASTCSEGVKSCRPGCWLAGQTRRGPTGGDRHAERAAARRSGDLRSADRLRSDCAIGLRLRRMRALEGFHRFEAMRSLLGARRKERLREITEERDAGHLSAMTDNVVDTPGWVDDMAVGMVE